MSFIKRLLVFVIVFYYLFPFKLQALPEEISLSILHLIPLLYCLCRFEHIKRIFSQIRYNKLLFYSIGLYVALFLWAVIVFVVNGSADTSYFVLLRSVFLHVIQFLFITVIITEVSSRDKLMVSFAGFYVAACMVYVLTTVVMLLMPELHFFWQSLLVDSRNLHEALAESYDLTAGMTRYGLAGYSGFGTTMEFTVGMAFALYLCQNHKNIGWISIPFILLGNVCYGRIGAIVSLLLIAIFLSASLSVYKIKKIIGIFVYNGTIN